MLNFSSVPFCLSPFCTLLDRCLFPFSTAAAVFGHPPHPLADFTATPPSSLSLSRPLNPLASPPRVGLFQPSSLRRLPHFIAAHQSSASLIFVDVVRSDFPRVDDHRRRLFPCLVRSIELFWARLPPITRCHSGLVTARLRSPRLHLFLPWVKTSKAFLHAASLT